MNKPYGQIAYEVGAAWLLKRKNVRFVPWEDVSAEEREYWDAIAKALSSAFDEGRSASNDDDDCGVCGEIGAHRTGCPHQGS